MAISGENVKDCVLVFVFVKLKRKMECQNSITDGMVMMQDRIIVFVLPSQSLLSVLVFLFNFWFNKEW